MKSFITILTRYARLIRFSHSIFALPFAFASVLLVSKYFQIRSIKILWILIAMISARSAAMAFNRMIDSKIDALNPRTVKREIPQGIISWKGALTLAVSSSLLFIYSTFQLNILCAILSLPTLILFIFYPYTKRFTWLSHLFLGLSLGLAPLGAWVAFTESLQGPILLLGLSVLFWVAGFDIIYSTQDVEFDKSQGLFSIPAQFGIQKGLKIAMIFHGIALSLLIWTGILFHLSFAYFLGCSFIGAIMLYEHSLVNPTDLSKVQTAFNANGWISLLYLVSTWMGL